MSLCANLFVSLTFGLLLYVADGNNVDHVPVVHTSLGSLKGTYVTVKGKDTGAHAFLGVPFAKPPVNDLRLAPPQPVEGWNGERDATRQPHMCIQNKEISEQFISKLELEMEIPDISEDCLYLNIYTPANRAPDAKLPVMVWIHGGGLLFGAASSYDGSAMAAYEDVVVVLIQYRLGLLGFFSTGQADMAGNFGLLDQIEALKWVQQHIHNFGGNPDLVTIYGESAGGWSVSYLHLSPLSNGLFHRGIAQSGTAALELLPTDPLPSAQMVANVSGCSTENTDIIRDCVRNLDLQKIVDVSEMKEYVLFPITVDGRFLTKPVDELYRNHEIIKVPFMTGVTSDEGGWLLPSGFGLKNWTDGMTREEVKTLLSFFYPDPQDVKLNLILDEYTGKSDDPNKLRKAFTDFLADVLFTFPALKTIDAHKDAGAPVYFYEYNYAPRMLKKLRPDFVGADHTDDLFSVFGLCFTTTHIKMNEECSNEEEDLNKRVMKYWANFARTGSPNGDGLVHWPQYGEEENYLFIDAEQVVRQQLKKEHFMFFTQTLPKISAPVVKTALGSLKGTYVTVKGKESGAHAFLGVPFAKPPVNDLRLTPPQPVEGWDGERDATHEPPICVQSKDFLKETYSKLGLEVETPDISEDCLFLNIYTPANRAPDAKLPVMVWIHGGGFVMGAASSFDGSAMAAYENVVVVLIQYRLGLLGFFSTGEADMAGNFGLLDQVEALKWVQQHIHNFGGNPDLVTIYGESAGGMSVSLLYLSPLSNGLFHRGIAQSGTASLLELMLMDPLPLAQMVANMSGCSTENTGVIRDCLRNLDLKKIVELAEMQELRYTLTIDGHFLTKPVDELLRYHEIIKVPFMTGVTSDEGGFLLPSVMAPQNWTKGMTRQEVKSVLGIFYSDPKDIELDLIIDEYSGRNEDPKTLRKAFTDFLGDLLFSIPAVKAINAHRDAGVPVYFYQYNYAPEMLRKVRPDFVGADHADDIFPVFGLCFTTKHVKITEECSKEEKDITKRVMKYWANFARTGSPNGDGLVHWPQYGQEENYLVIDTEQVVRQQRGKERFTFITQTLPKISAPVVHTSLGSLKGTYVTVKGKESGVHVFLGVPFAKPPVDTLRLTPPQPVEGWDGERDATRQPHMCIQNKALVKELGTMLGVETEIPDISEDCLYLNIYTPVNRAPDAKLPVMVWIHGGGFTMGAASSYDGSVLSAYEDVVVVVIQYRLGLLGFFSTGEADMAGNFGLLDQIEALKWVQQHIHNFGGNPDLVTIFGESAGGMSVSFLHLSPLSNGLFHRGIAQSGAAALFPQNDPLPLAQFVANMSGCSTENTGVIRDCMRNLDLKKIVELAEVRELGFLITVDGRFLTKPVDELFRNHEIIQVPYMTGVTNDEGGWLLPSMMAPQNWTKGMTRQEIKSILGIFYPDPKDVALDLAIDEYTERNEDPETLRKAFTELLADFLFNIPAVTTINAHKDAGVPVYFYEHSFSLQMLKKLRPDYVGADHGDDIFTVMGLCFTTKHVKMMEECSKEEKDITKSIMKYWANFARTGSPNGDGLVHWPQYGQEENYLVIDTEQVVRQQLRKERIVFITQTLPKISAPVVQTSLGSLKGTYVTVKRKETGVHVFLGVPFAKPPVNALRLTPPQSVEGWDGERDATQQPHMCIQNKAFAKELFSKIGVEAEIPEISEDCLYLNIYTPANRGPDAKLPVMVWIHGGGFVMGAASSYDGSAMAAYENVVVVLIQYRLGLLGFFSTGEADMAGNFGLLDQVEALKWVQQHIHNFGGNPDLVTIYGESAGGMSVSFLHLSPLSNGLFHRGIAQSGTAAVDLPDDPLSVAHMVANMSGCSTESTAIIRDCVRNLELQKIVELSEAQELRYIITIDGRFLTKPVDELFRNHEIIKVPFMTGVTSDEGGFLLPGFMAPQNWTEGMTREEVKSILSMLFPDKSLAIDLLIDEFTGKSEDPQKLRRAFTDLLGDFIFNIPAKKTINAHKDAGIPVYFYEYNFAPRMLKKHRPDFVRADHGDDLFTVFGFCFTTKHVKINEECSEEEEAISKSVMKYWAAFARTGSPNGDGLVHWPQYGDEENYLVIDTEPVVHQHLMKEHFVFMTQTLPEMLKEQQKKEHTEL